jgi:hypothetical protein
MKVYQERFNFKTGKKNQLELNGYSKSKMNLTTPKDTSQE